MAMSSQRFILLIVAINLVLFLASAMYNTAYETNTLSTEMNKIKTESEFLDNNFGKDTPDSNQLIGAESFGSEKVSGLTVWNVLSNGLAPIPTDRNSHWLENLLRIGMNLFRYLMMILTALEIYMIFVNKKT